VDLFGVDENAFAFAEGGDLSVDVVVHGAGVDVDEFDIRVPVGLGGVVHVGGQQTAPDVDLGAGVCVVYILGHIVENFAAVLIVHGDS